MNSVTRFAASLICFVVAFQAVWLWNQTGRARETHFHNPMLKGDALVSADPDPITQALVKTGLEDPANASHPNRFQFGLLPSGFDHRAMSVATFGGPLGLVGIWLLLGAGVKNNKGKGKKKG